MVIGTKQNGTTLILLSLYGPRIHVELTEPFKPDENNPKELGHVTAICILPPDKEDKRMGHSDLQILLGYSLGAILIYRVRVNVYSYKASRLRGPIDISDFVEFPGFC
ncbi:hypothetical protein EDC96DRAFT_33588 [Choanephora cucurbitarum]|nr:hypothetical protein EDC96DRAFT_33588 [Choanephora cucurbitarum]